MADGGRMTTPNSLHVLGGEELTGDPPFKQNNRPPSSGFRPPRPDSSTYTRTPTPSKQISLQAVPRKQETDFGEVNGTGDVLKELENMKLGMKNSEAADTVSDNCFLTEAHVTVEDVEHPTRATNSVKGAVVPRSENESASSDDDDDDDEDDEEEKKKAPNELLMEFVTCVMEEDYVNAEKLCRMILMYEPDNPEALKFHPVIKERLQLDEEAENESDDSDEEDSSDDDSGEDSGEDSGDSDEDSDTNSDESSKNSEDEEEEVDDTKPDSGIASSSASD